MALTDRQWKLVEHLGVVLSIVVSLAVLWGMWKRKEPAS